MIGSGRALDLILSGRTVAAEEALALGLVTEVVAPGRARRARAGARGGSSPRFPQETMLSGPPRGRWALHLRLADGLALEAAAWGVSGSGAASEGAKRFAAERNS